jgi:hypothetical protein
MLGEPSAEALLKVMVLVLESPTATPPKSTEELVIVRLALKLFDDDVPAPPQELAKATANRIKAK